jgi:hypothetical protein
MKTPSEIVGAIRDAILHPTGGVVGVVDDVLAVCAEHELSLDWQADRCRIRPAEGGWEELIDVPMRKPVFRAILARIAVLCNERSPGSVSPYGGEGVCMAGARTTSTARVVFINQPGEQRLTLTPTSGVLTKTASQATGNGSGVHAEPR